MNKAQILATILLILRLIALTMIGAVLRKQVKQMRTTTTDYPAIRKAIFLLTVVLFVGQFIPIILDTIVAVGGSYAGRRAPELLGVAYSLNNALKDVAIGVLLLFIHYRIFTPEDKNNI